MFSNWFIKVVLVILGVGCFCSSSMAAFTDFEDLSNGTTYTDGDSFTSNGVGFNVSGTKTLYVRSAPNSDFGSTTLVNGNVTLDFILTEIATEIEFDLGFYGGFMEIAINGKSTERIRSLSLLDGLTVGGVDIAISSASGGEPAYLTATGPISSFSFFGQETVMDNVSIVPEPATLLLTAAGGLALLKRKRV